MYIFIYIYFSYATRVCGTTDLQLLFVVLSTYKTTSQCHLLFISKIIIYYSLLRGYIFNTKKIRIRVFDVNGSLRMYHLIFYCILLH